MTNSLSAEERKGLTLILVSVENSQVLLAQPYQRSAIVTQFSTVANPREVFLVYFLFIRRLAH